MRNASFVASTFTIYRSSAGSGKTRTLAKEYLKLALRLRSHYFRHILAVTFTNKATQEMKDRILAYLDEFATGKSGLLADELKAELNLDDSTFRQYAQETQSAVLHGYATFSISTIDAFFQKVIRSFTREAGLVGDYRLEIDQDTVLEDVINNLIDELGTNPELTRWVVEFAKENLENERAWDVRQSLMEFSREIFREEFKEIEEDVIATTAKPAYFRTLRDALLKIRDEFLRKVNEPAKEAMTIIGKQAWSYEDVAYKSNSGLKTFLTLFANAREVKTLKEIKSRIRETFANASKWVPKGSPYGSSIFAVADRELVPRIQAIIDVHQNEYTAALSAEVALGNLYVFGLIADISRKLREYKDENNLMLLADAPKFLNGVIQDSDTPFIYEKVGSFYKHYLIDEFQDTSGLQWKNFLPLLTNSLDQGDTSLVVGDVKQAIYRWRGGDLNLLQRNIEESVGRGRSEIHKLNRNFRSSTSVIRFNNALFETAAKVVGELANDDLSVEAYADVAQETHRDVPGFVEVKFLSDQQDGPSWKDQALDEIPRYLEKLQQIGVPLNDIAILVRRNDEGQQIIAHLLAYKDSDQAKPGMRYDVVSNESLRIDTASTVVLLESALRYLLNPDDDIARAQLAFEFSRLHNQGKSWTEVFSVTNQSVFESFLPPEFAREKSMLKKLPLFELTENLIRIFRLGNQEGELPHLQAFQNLVLDFFTRERNDLGAFLEWWDMNKLKKSIPVSGSVNAAQVITVHKSKGLQFPYVIIPFCSWSMDHESFKAPNLWVKATEGPFSDSGYLPVRYSSVLANTIFQSDYHKEFTRSHLDNLNLLYVAVTRAETGMIVTAPDLGSRGFAKSIASVLHESIHRSEILSQSFDAGQATYSVGEWQTRVETRTLVGETIQLPRYVSSNWREKLVIRHDATHFFEESEDSKDARINYGIHIHAVLSRIRYMDEIPEALLSMQQDGFITIDERALLEKQLADLLSNERIRSWFSPGWSVKTEVPILLPDGTENRIDRLLVKDRSAIVIDFKTGERSPSDKQQVLNYIEVLRKMNFPDVEGYLLYVKTGEVNAVSPPRGRIVKQRDNRNQLDLGL
jgi:ATP-dependent exoDNAse (exonuclease V) beta subunit